MTDNLIEIAGRSGPFTYREKYDGPGEFPAHVHPGNCMWAFNGYGIDEVLAVRRLAIEERENWLASMKAAQGARDYDTAKFCKGLWKDAGRNVSASGLIAGQIGGADLPGDCQRVAPKDWPRESVPHLNEVRGRMIIRALASKGERDAE